MDANQALLTFPSGDAWHPVRHANEEFSQIGIYTNQDSDNLPSDILSKIVVKPFDAVGQGVYDALAKSARMEASPMLVISQRCSPQKILADLARRDEP